MCAAAAAVLQKGVVTMMPDIVVHDDYCSTVSNDEISDILEKVTALISKAILLRLFTSISLSLESLLVNMLPPIFKIIIKSHINP